MEPLFLDQRPKQLTWYNCGPTVYDAAHLGHARTYVTLDMLQRIVSHHFGVPLFTAMGMTDVDDKIIKRASEKVGKRSPCSNVSSTTISIRVLIREFIRWTSPVALRRSSGRICTA